MAYDVDLAYRVRVALNHTSGLSEKRMFGGVGFMLNGNMCLGIWKNSLIARIGIGYYQDALREPHVREFDITGRPMRGWVLIEPDGIESVAELSRWCGRAVEFVSSLPPKS